MPPVADDHAGDVKTRRRRFGRHQQRRTGGRNDALHGPRAPVRDRAAGPPRDLVDNGGHGGQGEPTSPSQQHAAGVGTTERESPGSMDALNDCDGSQGPSPLVVIPATIFNPLTGLTAFLPTLLRISEAPAPTVVPDFTGNRPVPVVTLTPRPTATTLPAVNAPPPPIGAPGALNPQVVTVSSVTVMTATSVLTMPKPAVTNPPSSLMPSAVPFMTAGAQAATAVFDHEPSPTIVTGSEYRGGRNRPPNSLSESAEHALISAGSIGVFILMCSICWIGWRVYKRRQRAKYGMDLDDDHPPSRGPSLMYESASKSARGPTAGNISSTHPSRPASAAKPSARQGPMALPQLDTNVGSSPSFYSHVNPFSASTLSSSPHGSLPSRSAQSPPMLSAQHSVPYANQQLSGLRATLTQPPTSFSPDFVINNPFASPEDALVSPDSSPSNATQYGGDGTQQTFPSFTTERSRLSGYFKQSELARSASAAYDPASRAVNRASALSSISSGFGDGDIIVPPPVARQQDPLSRSFSYTKTAGSLSRANSIAGRSEVGAYGQRDTIYTATSEDSKARYRSVNSWVYQQAGRLDRQQRRDNAEYVPPVPSLPPVDRFTMMMDDGEEPRRWNDDTQFSQPPVPALPSQTSEASAMRNTQRR